MTHLLVVDDQLKERHRDRAVRAMAKELCTLHFTDGFCGGPRDGEPLTECICARLATACARALDYRGVLPIWIHDPALEGKKQ